MFLDKNDGAFKNTIHSEVKHCVTQYMKSLELTAKQVQIFNFYFNIFSMRQNYKKKLTK